MLKRAEPREGDRRRRLLRGGSARAPLRPSIRSWTSRSGPGTIPHLGDWLGAGGMAPRSRFGTGEERAFAGTLPMHRERSFQAWVQVSMGCNSVCSYCIVPRVRGRKSAARLGDPRRGDGPRGEGVRESRSSARTSTPGDATSARVRGRAPPSLSAPATRSTASTGSASRAPTRRTSAPGDRRHGRMRRRLRARAPAAPVRVDPDPEGDAANVQPRALPACSPPSCAPRFRISR